MRAGQSGGWARRRVLIGLSAIAGLLVALVWAGPGRSAQHPARPPALPTALPATTTSAVARSPGPGPAPAPTAGQPAGQPSAAGSGPAGLRAVSQKVCQLTGETDRSTSPPAPTANRTASRWGLAGTDNGFSFEVGDRAWFLFGDSVPTTRFDGRDNSRNPGPGRPGDNDAIGYTTARSVGNCLSLSFFTDAIGAYARPTVTTAAGQAPVTLRVNETPQAGVTEGDRVFVVFGTDNFASNPPGSAPHPAGGPTRTVVAVAPASSTALRFRYLYDLSVGDQGKFTFVSVAADGAYVDFWGARAAGQQYRHSPVYFARKPASAMGGPGGMEYYAGLDAAGQPVFSPEEAAAVPLFSDTPEPCAAESSVDWNRYLDRWVMLYNCADSAPGHPRGIYLRVAPAAWGPWSPPVTAFATTDGLCRFIHRAVTPGQPPCDSLSEPARAAVQGGDYAPAIIDRLTTGSPAGPGHAAVTTIFYTMSTWNPYQVVLMKATVQLTP